MWNTNSVDFSNAKKDPNDVLPVDKSKVRDDSRQGKSLCSIFVLSSRLPIMITQLHVTFVLYSTSLQRILKFAKFFPTSPSLVAISSLALPVIRQRVFALIRMPSRTSIVLHHLTSSTQLAGGKLALTRHLLRSSTFPGQTLLSATSRTREQRSSMRAKCAPQARRPTKHETGLTARVIVPRMPLTRLVDLRGMYSGSTVPVYILIALIEMQKIPTPTPKPNNQVLKVACRI
jgi:hypothetical protein